jgi:thioredoxin reductase
MNQHQNFEVVIVGGSYAGLSAALALGRALRTVLIIDSGQPCNRQTPHSHNFLTRDGETPAAISETAKKQVMAYPTIHFLEDKVIDVQVKDNNFVVTTTQNHVFGAQKILFATGVKDIMPSLPGFSECWGISAIHCPYCHGYEYKQRKTGILINGEMALQFGKLIRNWTDQVTIYTNGPATFDQNIRNQLLSLAIGINETEIESLAHENGYLEKINFRNQTDEKIDALYARLPFEQHCLIPQQLGCELTDMGHIRVDDMQKTRVPGIYAAGDNTIIFRSISIVNAAGTKAGAMINHELIDQGH